MWTSRGKVFLFSPFSPHSLTYCRVWDQLQNSDLPPPKEDMAKWESEFSQLMNAQRDELEDYGTNMQKTWEGGVGSYDGVGQGIKFNGEGIPILGDYSFGMSNVTPISYSLICLERREKQQIPRTVIPFIPF